MAINIGALAAMLGHRQNLVPYSAKPEHQLGPRTRQTLRLLSFNMQAGMEVQRFSHYVTRSWQNILPARDKIKNLHKILIFGYLA